MNANRKARNPSAAAIASSSRRPESFRGYDGGGLAHRRPQAPFLLRRLPPGRQKLRQAQKEAVALSCLSSLRLWRSFGRSSRRTFRCGGALLRLLCLLFACGWRPDLHRFHFKRAVLKFQIRAPDLFILGNISHGRRVASLGDVGALGDFERPRCLFARNRKRFRVLIDCRNGPAKRDWAHGLGSGRSGRRCGSLWGSRR